MNSGGKWLNVGKSGVLACDSFRHVRNNFYEKTGENWQTNGHVGFIC